MLRRRDLILSLPLVAAAGAAAALTPRKRLNLLGDRKIEAMIPETIGPWSVIPSNALVLPKPREGSLAAELYSQQVSRLYVSEQHVPIMMVIAYGDTQSDTLQLHRPEVCYTAVGFEIRDSRPSAVSLGGSQLPVRELVAHSNDRVEPIIYWTRIGDFLPVSGNQQRVVRLQTEMSGYIPDGVLVRLSTVAPPEPKVFAELRQFASMLLTQSNPAVVPALVGRPLARAILGPSQA